MSIESVFRKGAAVFLIVVAAILGAAVLDEIHFNKITSKTAAELDRRFQERSTKIGAWVMDREIVTEHIGFPVEDLPSHQWAKQHKQEAE